MNGEKNNDEYQTYLNNSAQELNIDYTNYKTEFCNDNTKSGTQGLQRRVTVTVEFSPEQMIVVRCNMKSYKKIQALADFAKNNAIDSKGIQNSFVCNVYAVDIIEDTKIKVIGDSVCTIDAVVRLLLKTVTP